MTGYRRQKQWDGAYWEYAYDGRERLTSAVRNNKSSPTIVATYEYTYDDGDNMLTRVTPWFDDFQDGNITGWSGDTGYFAVTGGVLENTVDASVWREVYLSESDADHDLRFDYIRYSATGTAQHNLRYTDGNNLLWLQIIPGAIHLRQRDGGVGSTLVTYNTTVSQDTWYTARVVLDGADVSVYWGEKGGDSSEVLSTGSATELTTTRASFLRASPSSEHGWDNIQLIAGTLSTAQTFTHNGANEQLTSAVNGVTTTMAYDAWGRLTTRDDSTHEATYAYRYGGKLYSFTSDFPYEGAVTYETGGDGKRRSRIAGAEETWYNWDASWIALSEEDCADGSTGSLVRSYIGWLTAHVDGSAPASGDYKYFNLDNLFSVRQLRNEDKSSYAELDYGPYGVEFAAVGNTGQVSRRYTGHVWDAIASIYYAPFRYYSNSATRWLSRDPLGMIDGPNQYSYAMGAPTTYVDPLGLACGPGNGIGERVVPEYCNPFKNKFSDACKEHDCPHEDKTRKECDKEFLKNMRDTCSGIGKPLCKACAKIYYWAVRVGGKGPYDSDRKCER